MTKNNKILPRTLGVFAFCIFLQLATACQPPVFTISGTLEGLAEGEAVVLDLNGEEQISVLIDGGFLFTFQVEQGQPYAVTVTSTPPMKVCEVAGGDNLDGTGDAITGDVSDILVTCEDLTIADALANVPDPGLANCISDAAAAPEPDMEFVYELTALTCDGITNPSHQIADAEGLEQFAALTELNLQFHTFPTIDLSTLTELTFLTGVLSDLEEIDLTNNANLIYLQLQILFLRTISLEEEDNPDLTTVFISGNCWDETMTNESGTGYLDLLDPVGERFTGGFTYLPNNPNCSDPAIDNETCVYDATVMSTTNPCSATDYACRENIVTAGDPAAECADGSLAAPAACPGGVYTEAQNCAMVADAEGWTYTGSCTSDGGVDYYMYGDCDCVTNFTNCWGCEMLGGSFTCLMP